MGTYYQIEYRHRFTRGEWKPLERFYFEISKSTVHSFYELNRRIRYLKKRNPLWQIRTIHFTY